MPVVPFTSRRPGADGSIAPAPPPLDWALIAAAQMHSEGRLIDPKSRLPMSSNIEDRRTEKPEGDHVDDAAEIAAVRLARAQVRTQKGGEPLDEIK